MTPEELNQPRVKIIAPIPFVNSHVGEWKELRNGFYPLTRIDQYGKLFTEDINPFMYPANFSKMTWWEGRGIEDMPEYVKTRMGSDGKIKPEVIVPATWHFDDEIYFDSEYTHCTIPHLIRMHPDLLPATKEEYEEYISEKSNQ